MTAIYPTRHVYVDSDNDGIPETDISSRVVGTIDLDSGIKDYRDINRLASVGSLSFTIRNDDGAYTNVASSLIGKKISITLTVGTREKQVWFGVISPKSDIDPGTWGPRRVTIKANDWVDVANSSRVGAIELAVFVTADEAIPTLLAATPLAPANTSLDNGFERFPNMFDGALKTTTVYSELDKITKSELGYLYLTFRDNAYGETLRFEDYLHRGSTHILSSVPSDVATPFFLKYHGNAGATGYLKYHGNAGETGKIKLSQAQAAAFGTNNTNSMRDAEWKSGENVVNQMSVNNIPRKTDASLVVLYRISSPIQIGTTKKLIIDGSYSDPNGGTLISAVEIVISVSDYTFNSAADGTGTDLIGNLEVLFVKGAGGFHAELVNDGPAGYLTSFQVRGKGRYKYSRIETLRSNTESQTTLIKSVEADSINREYSANYDVSENFANMVLAQDRAPRKIMKTASFVANTSEHLMLAFMYLEAGDKVRITESSPLHTGDYYIQAVKASIMLGGIVTFTWYLKEDISTICTPMAVLTNTQTGATENAINFGVLPYMSNLPAISYSFWLKVTDATDAVGYLIGKTADDGAGRRGNNVFLDGQKIYFRSYKTPNDGSWITTSAVITTADVWYHIVITYDNTTDLADPIVYVNNSVAAMTETGTPSGGTDDDSDIDFILFNAGRNPSEVETYDAVSYGHGLKDVRAYGRILSPAEVTTLYNGEDDYTTVQTGLLFNGIFAPTDNIDDYIGTSISGDDLVLDIVHGAAGIPFNEDETSVNIMLKGEAL